MAAHTISRTTIAAVLVATIAALVGRAWLQIRLIQDGAQPLVAADISYLVVPPILILLLFPLWRSEKTFLISQFDRKKLTWKLALSAIAIGVLVRLLWWSQLIAGVSFGIYTSSDPNAIVGPTLSFQCASPTIVLLGFIVMAILVPLIEEIVHRGYFQTALRHRGAIVSVLLSALVFAIFHKLASWPFAFLAGVIFGTQYWVTRSLWSSLISHATINGLIQVDWRCLSGQWNPRADELPLLLPGVTAVLVLVSSLLLLFFLIHKMATEARNSPR